MSNGLMYVCMACLFMELWLTLDCSGRAWWLCEQRNVYICDCPSRGWRKCVRWWIVQRHLECVRDDIDIDSCITNILHILRFVWNLDVCGDVDFLHSNQLCGCVCEYTACASDIEIAFLRLTTECKCAAESDVTYCLLAMVYDAIIWCNMR